jgi:polyvinyl alcohol dehydrogenase (cytochrome)
MSILRKLAQGWPLPNPLLAILIAPPLIVLVPIVVRAQTVPATQWPMGGHDLSGTWNQPFATVGVSNVNQLTSKWVFTTSGSVSATPAVFNGVVYFPDWAGYFYSVDASTGQLIWKRKISHWTGVSGDFARDDPAFDGGEIILGDQGGQLSSFSTSGLTGPGARVIAVNAASGQAIWVTQVDGFQGAVITGSPILSNGVVYVGVSSTEETLATIPGYFCCSFRGSVVALSEATGQILWKTYDMPLSPSNPGGYSGGAVWDSTPVVDASRGYLYVGTGNNYTVPSDVTTCITNAQQNNESDDVCNTVDNYAQDYFDSVLALDVDTGAIKWVKRVQGYDAYTFACQGLPPGVTWCPSPDGPDYDFGAGLNFFTVTIKGTSQDVIGVGQKSGIYWALNPDNGNLLWDTLVGPGSFMGGIQWGTATDGRRIFVPLANALNQPYTLQPSGQAANGGSWAALDASTGRILWQTATPGICQGLFGTVGGCMALGPAAVANGVVFAGSMDPTPGNPTMFALNAANGQILWSFAAGSSVNAAPAIVGNSLYWGSGYRFGSSNNKLYAFALPGS